MTDALASALRDADPKNKRPSRITVPERCHPLTKIVFSEMQRQNVTYSELEWRSGVQISTFKAWRVENRPGLETVEAALGALGWSLVPVPPLGMLKPETLAAVEEIGQEFISNHATLGAILATVCKVPVIGTQKNPAPRVPTGVCR